VNRGLRWGKLKEGNHLEERGIDGRLILKLICEKGAGGMDWIDLAQERDKWQALVNTVMNLPGSIKCGEFRD
jgi:hypothetical protein